MSTWLPKAPFIGRDYDPYYSWFRRYEELGLDLLRDRSKRPKVSPLATPPESSPRSSTSIPTITSAPTADTGRSKGTSELLGVRALLTKSAFLL
jgi:hypothetical protein